MRITDVQLEGSSITFSLAGGMSLGSVPIIDLLIRRSRRLGLSVRLDMTRITTLDGELARHVCAWRQEGVTLCGTSHLAFDAPDVNVGPAACMNADGVEFHLQIDECVLLANQAAGRRCASLRGVCTAERSELPG